jgi:isopentenyl phosphate kinase
LSGEGVIKLSETIRAVYVKAGGSFITFKDRVFSVNYEALDSLVRIFRNIFNSGLKIILGNGGGSFAHPVVEALKGNGLRELLVHCQRATRRLNSIIVDMLLDAGIPAASVQTSAIIVDGRSVFIDPLTRALENNIIPVVYGECIYSARREYRVLSTEEVFMLLSQHIRPLRMVLLMGVDGVYDCDPSTCSSPKLIPIINKHNYKEVIRTLSGAGGIDVTGGIKAKVEHMMHYSTIYRVPVFLVSGFNAEEAVNAIVKGSIGRGTIIKGF